MPGKRQHINALFLYIDGHMANGLNRIGMQDNLLFMADLCNFRNRENGPNFIIGIHNTDQSGLRTNGTTNVFRRNQTILIDRQVGHLKALRL